MIRHRLQGSLAIALLELRCVRRAVGTWLLALLALAAGWAAFLFYHHAAVQDYSAHYSGNIVPGRFLMAGYSACFLAPLLAGVALLVDQRHRDQSAAIREVLDSRPASNLAFFAGRLAALAAAMWLVCAVFVVVMQVAGLAADRWFPAGALDGWLGPVEPWSLVAFLFVDALPALVLWAAVALFLAAALRNRLAVAAIALALLAGYGWLLLHAPLRLLPAISVLSGFADFASDMLPRALAPESAALRGAQVLLAAGLVALGAACHDRADRASRTPSLVGGLAFVVAGGCAIALLAQSAFAAPRQREAWLAAHSAHRDAPAPDLARLSADVFIEPGRALRVDAVLDLVPPAEPAAEWVFSLNPGLRVRSAELNGREVPHRHQDGLLHISADEARAGTDDARAGATATLRVVAAGLPDPRFAYLDGVVDPLALGVADGHHRVLGTEPMVFSERYAVLLPGLRWLPAPGPNLEGVAPDFHDLELRLDVPAGWHAAAPGRRETLESPADRARHRFRTASPVPMAGVVAGGFERYAAKVAGVEMELLLHPGHRRNAEFFAPDAQRLLNTTLGMRLQMGMMAGFRYPHRRFSVVEVPGRLRGFGGGWELDTTLALPGVALLREYGLPSMRMTMWPYHMATFVMPNDFTGGDPTIALTRSMMRYRASAAGPHATMLNFVVDELAKGALHVYWPAFFSAHHHGAAGRRGAAAEVLDRMMGHGAAVDREIEAAAGRVAVSPEFLTGALGELQFADDAKRALDMLNFKGRMLADTLLAGWPQRGEAKVLREVVRRHEGGTYTLDDLRAAARAAGAPLDSVVGEWWAGTELPGFVASPLDAYRLQDGPEGRPRYQLRLHVCNEEASPGLVRLDCRGSEATQDCPYGSYGVPSGDCIEIGAVTDFPPTQARLATYLSKNGNGITFPALSIDAARTIDAPPLQGSRPSEWRPPASADVVVDDLSPGFALRDAPARGLGFRGRQPAWTRGETPGSWGKYSRTAIWSEPGDGDRSATFGARLPAPGRWRLHYHMPGAELTELEGSVAMSIRHVRTTHKLGSHEMTLVEHRDVGASADAGQTAGGGNGRDEHDAGGAGRKSTRIEFDGRDAVAGWNHLGDFDLESPQVSLVVTDRTDGAVVVADAIRWRPID